MTAATTSGGPAQVGSVVSAPVTFGWPPGSESVTWDGRTAERMLAWLRVPLLGLFVLAEALSGEPTTVWFVVAFAVACAWTAVLFALAGRAGPAWRHGPLVPVLDLIVVAGVALSNSGPSSPAQLALIAVPFVVAVQRGPTVTAPLGVATVVGYALASAVRPGATTHGVVVRGAYVAWLCAAAVLVSWLLARGESRRREIMRSREDLLNAAVAAEELARRTLAEQLHDTALQTVLAARHDVSLARTGMDAEALDRADAALRRTARELREAVFELHPAVLDQVGLAAAVTEVAQAWSRRGGLAIRVDTPDPWPPRSGDDLLYGVVRELLSNVVRHARASSASVRVDWDSGTRRIVVTDDGVGLDEQQARTALARGHVGLAGQQARVEAAGGSFAVRSRPGQGTAIEVRLPR